MVTIACPNHSHARDSNPYFISFNDCVWSSLYTLTCVFRLFIHKKNNFIIRLPGANVTFEVTCNSWKQLNNPSTDLWGAVRVCWRASVYSLLIWKLLHHINMSNRLFQSVMPAECTLHPHTVVLAILESVCTSYRLLQVNEPKCEIYRLPDCYSWAPSKDM